MIKLKFNIIYQSKEISTDERTSHTKSWKMRGATWHKFWYSGKEGLPSITVDVMPKTIVVYMDRGQKILAESMQKAKDIAWYAAYRAKDAFIAEQQKFGVLVEIGRTGEEIVKPHAGLVLSEKGPLKPEDPVLPGLWMDKSTEKELGPGFAEVEGHMDNPVLTDAEECLIAARDLRATLPAAMQEINDKLNVSQRDVLRVEALIQGGITQQQQYHQMINFMTKALDTMAALQAEVRELKSRQ